VPLFEGEATWATSTELLSTRVSIVTGFDSLECGDLKGLLTEGEPEGSACLKITASGT
jgi:hypothetical protein